MIMTRRLRTFVLTAHVTSSVGWLGAVVAYLALAVAALTSQDAQTVRAAWTAMELTGWFVIVPLALASVLIGVVNALGTSWGLFRHYWVLVKFLLTVVATLIVLLHMPTVSYFAGVAAETDGALLGGLWGELLHAGGGLLVLLVTTTLSVYKPRGLTRYGRRKQQERHTTSQLNAPRGLTGTRNRVATRRTDLPSHPPDANNDTRMEPDRGLTTGTPWRLYVLLGIIGLVLLLVVLHLTGGGLRVH